MTSYAGTTSTSGAERPGVHEREVRDVEEVVRDSARRDDGARGRQPRADVRGVLDVRVLEERHEGLRKGDVHQAPPLDDAVHRRLGRPAAGVASQHEVATQQADGMLVTCGVGLEDGMPGVREGRVGVGQARAGRRTATGGRDRLGPDSAVALDHLRRRGEVRAPGHLDVAHGRDAQARAVEPELPPVIAAGEHAVGDLRGVQRHQPVRAARGEERGGATRVTQEDVRRSRDVDDDRPFRDVRRGSDPGPSSAIHGRHLL